MRNYIIFSYVVLAVLFSLLIGINISIWNKTSKILMEISDSVAQIEMRLIEEE
jgi:ABC-type proline/glycine betaine transport system permease subunit